LISKRLLTLLTRGESRRNIIGQLSGGELGWQFVIARRRFRRRVSRRFMYGPGSLMPRLVVMQRGGSGGLSQRKRPRIEESLSTFENHEGDAVVELSNVVASVACLN
jgi:hypothetical protein